MRALTGARLFTGEAMLDGFSLIVDGGRIADLVPDDRVPANAETIRSIAEQTDLFLEVGGGIRPGRVI